MAELWLDAQPRVITGRKVKQIRAQGLVPVVVYGAQQEPAVLQVGAREFEQTLHAGGISQLVRVSVAGGETHNVLIRDIQRHPVNHSLMHADLYAVNMSEKQQVSVAIHQVGEMRQLPAGFMMLQALDQVEIEALPGDIPSHVEVDISGLTADTAITVADMPQMPGVEFLTNPDEVVFTIITTRVEEEEEEEEILDGEMMAEPEVLTGSKSDEEDEDE